MEKLGSRRWTRCVTKRAMLSHVAFSERWPTSESRFLLTALEPPEVVLMPQVGQTSGLLGGGDARG